MKHSLLLVLAVFVPAACGSSRPKTSTTTQVQAKDEHPGMSPELTSFHDVLKPRWHAAPGEQRMKDTCGAIPEFQVNAEALVKTTPPAGADATKWTASTKELGDAVTALDATCKANDAAAFEPAFHRVHEGFHAVMGLGGGMHDMHGEHQHPM